MRRIAVRSGNKFNVSVGFCVVGLATALGFMAVTTDPADARSRRKRVVHAKPAAASITSDARYAAIVVDANTGDTMHAANADSLRHPASLTKIMTLYLLFERLEAGKIALDTEMDVSAHAASQSPTKLGLRPGQTLEVEDAIKGLVTKSANDAAVVVAEHLAGDEDDFATMMTRKARALGMSRTTYKNASGLPDGDQVTTARDQALLGIAIQERFPRYYRYFSTPSFTYKGRSMRNHNRLLGRVAGVDGIKTGYTNASGFNLVTSMRRGNRHLVAVVLGGRSGGQRDARMATLLDQYVMTASTQRGATKVAEAAADRAKVKPVDFAELPAKTKMVVAGAPMALAPEPANSKTAGPATIPVAAIALPRPGSTDPIKPLLVRTVSVKPGAMRTASLTPPADSAPVATASVRAADRDGETATAPAGARPGILGTLPVKTIAPPEPAQVSSISAARSSSHAPDSKARSGWMIQVGAFEDETEARQRLSSAKTKASSLLGDADPFTEQVVKGERKLFRARFAGLEKVQAESACRTLKRNDIACMAIKN